MISKIDTVPKTAVLMRWKPTGKRWILQKSSRYRRFAVHNTDSAVGLHFQISSCESLHDEDTITDQPQRQIVAEMIREDAGCAVWKRKFHGIAVAVERMEFKEHIVNIDATIITASGILQGNYYRQAGQHAQKDRFSGAPDIEDMLECQVNLQLWVKVKKDWRDSDFLLKTSVTTPADTGRTDRTLFFEGIKSSKPLIL